MLDYLCINKNSNNKEYTESLLESFLLYDTQINFGKPYLPIHKDLSFFKSLEDYDVILNSPLNKVYKYMLNNGRSFDNISFPSCGNIVESYVNDEIDLESAVNSMFEKSDMYLNE